MKAESLSTLSDAEVVARLVELVREECGVAAAVLVHLGEVEARGLHLAAACASMFVYCVRVLGMSEDQAFKRIRAARVARRFPAVAAAVAEGRLHLAGVVLLAPHLTVENVDALVAQASGKSKAEIEVVLARWAPRADVSERIERFAEQTALGLEPGPARERVAPGPVPGGAVARVAPLSPGRFALQVTISDETRAKLMRAQALMRHQVPSGDLSEVLDRALDALLERVEGRKLGRTRAARAEKKSAARAQKKGAARAAENGAPRAEKKGAPRAEKKGTARAEETGAARGATTRAGRRHVPRAVRREVVARDGLRCAFVAADGRRCEETGFLELDHVVPVARGGGATVDGMRVLCRAHNQFEAERILGRERVAAGRARAGKSMRGGEPCG